MAAAYHVLKKEDEATVKEIDKDCKNKWKFQWLEEKVTVKVNGKDFTATVGDSIGKINVSGKAVCEWCASMLTYKGKGASTLKEHLKTDGHISQIKTRQSNYSLGSFVNPSSTKKLFPMFGTPKLRLQPDNQKEEGHPKPVPMVPLKDRVATMESMILSVMAQHSMPLTYAPVLVDVAKACSTDPQALAEVQLGKSAAAYKLRFGLAKTAMEKLIQDLRSSPFSLNIDEATCFNTKKVLTILVNYQKDHQIKTHHLASVEITKADSETIYNAICAIFEEHQLPWDNLISLLFDSCAVMRGHISGVETRIRTEKAQHLLDVDGDSCHHMQIIAKKFSTPFGGKLEALFSNIYTDFKWCSEHKMFLKEICDIIKIPYTSPQMYSGTRWLSCYDRAIDTLQMMDAYKLFYFSFLSSETDRDAYRPVMKEILEKHSVDVASRKRIYKILTTLSKKKGTKEGMKRKASIINSLFFTSDETHLMLNVYASVLAIFKEYVCFFQTKVPMAHKLHDFQLEAFRKFLCCFMRPEKIPNKLTEAKVSESSSHLPLQDIYIGQASTAPTDFLEKALQGYVSAAQMMLIKLPIYNSTLLSLSALDPCLTNHTVIKKHLDKLGATLPHILSESESKTYPDEVRKFVNDKNLPPYMENERVDEWWSQDSLTLSYPSVTKVSLAALTIFHGPQVESTFSEMSRIITKQTASIQVKLLNAIQIVKYELKSTNCTALKYFTRKNPKTDPIDTLLCRNIRNAFTFYEQERKANQRVMELKQKVMEKAEKNKKQIAAYAAVKKAAFKQMKKCELAQHAKAMKRKQVPSTNQPIKKR